MNSYRQRNLLQMLKLLGFGLLLMAFTALRADDCDPDPPADDPDPNADSMPVEIVD